MNVGGAFESVHLMQLPRISQRVLLPAQRAGAAKVYARNSRFNLSVDGQTQIGSHQAKGLLFGLFADAATSWRGLSRQVGPERERRWGSHSNEAVTADRILCVRRALCRRTLSGDSVSGVGYV